MRTFLYLALFVLALELGCSGGGVDQGGTLEAAATEVQDVDLSVANGEPVCSGAVSMRHDMDDATHESVICTWTCATLGTVRARWTIVFGREISSPGWAWYYPERPPGC